MTSSDHDLKWSKPVSCPVCGFKTKFPLSSEPNNIYYSTKCGGCGTQIGATI